MAERLHVRGGAVAHTFALALQDPGGVDPVAGRLAAASEELPDLADFVGISGPNNRGIPWIEHRR